MGQDDDQTTQKHYIRFSPSYLRGVATNLRAARNEATALNIHSDA